MIMMMMMFFFLLYLFEKGELGYELFTKKGGREGERDKKRK
jgi:hypothetical protein